MDGLLTVHSMCIIKILVFPVMDGLGELNCPFGKVNGREYMHEDEHGIRKVSVNYIKISNVTMTSSLGGIICIKLLKESIGKDLYSEKVC